MVRNMKFRWDLGYYQLLCFARKKLIFLENFNIEGEITLFWRISIP